MCARASILPVVLTICLFTSLLLQGQSAGISKEDFISSYELKSVSSAGQDTLYYYYQNNHKELFAIEYVLEVRQPYPEIIRTFDTFFEHKLSREDLGHVLEMWQRKYEFHKEATRQRAVIYCAALACQKQSIDSLINAHSEALLSYRDNVISALSDKQKQVLWSLHLESMGPFERKKQGFLDAERYYSLETTPCIYDYMEYGFDLMWRIPCSNYYNLLGINMSALSFIDSLGIEDYLRAYSDFEIKLTHILGRTDCKAHMAIPFFVESLEPKEITTYRKRNALFFLFLHAYPEGVPLNSSAPAMIDSVRLPVLEDSRITLENLVDFAVLEAHKYAPFPIEEGTLSFVKEGSMTKDGEADVVGYVPFKTAGEKQEYLDNLNTDQLRSQHTKTEFGDRILYARTEREERRDLSEVMITMEGIIIRENEMVGFFWMTSSEQDFEQRLRTLVAAVKF